MPIKISLVYLVFKSFATLLLFRDFKVTTGDLEKYKSNPDFV